MCTGRSMSSSPPHQLFGRRGVSIGTAKHMGQRKILLGRNAVAHGGMVAVDGAIQRTGRRRHAAQSIGIRPHVEQGRKTVQAQTQVDLAVFQRFKRRMRDSVQW